VPKKRTFLSRRTISQSESNGQLELDPQVRPAVIIPAPRRSLQHGPSRSSDESCLKSKDETPQKCASNLMAQFAQPSRPADEHSLQPLCNASHDASNSSLERERNLPSITRDRSVDKFYPRSININPFTLPKKLKFCWISDQLRTPGPMSLLREKHHRGVKNRMIKPNTFHCCVLPNSHFIFVFVFEPCAWSIFTHIWLISFIHMTFLSKKDPLLLFYLIYTRITIKVARVIHLFERKCVVKSQNPCKCCPN